MKTIYVTVTCLGLFVCCLVVIETAGDCGGQCMKRSVGDPVLCNEFGPVCVGDMAYFAYINKMKWAEAEANCTNMGGSLLAMKNSDIDDAVTNLIRTEHLDDLVTTKGYWTGLTDVLEEGVWVWPDDDVMDNDNDYTNWSPGNPNNAKDNQHCVQLWQKKYDLKWDDDRCKKKKAYVCEFPNLGGPGGCSRYGP